MDFTKVKMEKVTIPMVNIFLPVRFLVFQRVERAESADMTMMSVGHAGQERRSRPAAAYTVIHLKLF